MTEKKQTELTCWKNCRWQILCEMCWLILFHLKCRPPEAACMEHFHSFKVSFQKNCHLLLHRITPKHLTRTHWAFP